MVKRDISGNWMHGDQNSVGRPGDSKRFQVMQR
jgi:hypothetical protein